MNGYINSFQSLGATDGPGIRFVVFMQGCPLRCGVCHNPDTWQTNTGKTYSHNEVAETVIRYKTYFGKDGGITVSGGEPLLQSNFVTELFKLCKANGINTCLDTSGCILNGSVKALLDVTDLVLLDIKYTDDALYRRHVGMPYGRALDFLKLLNEMKIPTTLRQVVIPTINDTKENDTALKALADTYACVDSVELLPFRKICQVKYDDLKIPFPFADIPEADPASVRQREQQLNA